MDILSDSVAKVDENKLGEDIPLTEEQQKRIHKNKEKALALRETRKKAKPYEEPATKQKRASWSAKYEVPQRATSSRNTHAGFIVDEDEDTIQKKKYRKVEDEGTTVVVSFYKING